MAKGGDKKIKTTAKPANVGKPDIKKTGKTAGGKKRTSTLAVKTEHGRKRLILAKSAKSAAKAKTTKLAKRGLRAQEPGAYSQSQGAALKEGIKGMARRSNLDEETYNRLMAMDERALEALYQNNNILFEIAFDYSGVETDPETGAYIVSDDKRGDFDFLIEQYNRLFPESAV